MTRKLLSGSKVYWVVAPKSPRGYFGGYTPMHCIVFEKKRDAVSYVESSLFRWRGHRLLQCSAFAEHAPRAARKRR